MDKQLLINSKQLINIFKDTENEYEEMFIALSLYNGLVATGHKDVIVNIGDFDLENRIYYNVYRFQKSFKKYYLMLLVVSLIPSIGFLYWFIAVKGNNIWLGIILSIVFLVFELFTLNKTILPKFTINKMNSIKKHVATSTIKKVNKFNKSNFKDIGMYRK